MYNPEAVALTSRDKSLKRIPNVLQLLTSGAKCLPKVGPQLTTDCLETIQSSDGLPFPIQKPVMTQFQRYNHYSITCFSPSTESHLELTLKGKGAVPSAPCHP